MPDDNGKHADGNTIAAMFLRGDGKNSAGTPGLHAADQMQTHKHRITQGANPAETPGPLDGADSTAGTIPVYRAASIGTDNRALSGVPYTGAAVGNPATGGNARHGTETRPAASTVIWCTTVAKVGANTGTVDVTVLSNTVGQQGTAIADIQSKQVFTKKWTSAALAWTQGGTLAPVHTLGVTPLFGVLKLRYKVAGNGMAVGQEEFISSTITTVSGQGNFGCSLRKPTSTSVEVITGGTGIFGATAAGAAIQVTPTQADLILELYA
jgi:hypothetical protein